MKKVMDISLEFKTDGERDEILSFLDEKLGKQGSTLARVEQHDCNHDSGKACRNKVVIRDDFTEEVTHDFNNTPSHRART